MTRRSWGHSPKWAEGGQGELETKKVSTLVPKKMARNFLLWMIFILLQVTYTLQDNETISGDSSETVDVASILALNDLAEETTITISNDEDIKEYEGNKSFSSVFCSF